LTVITTLTGWPATAPDGTAETDALSRTGFLTLIPAELET
jgi:hypothetical protein